MKASEVIKILDSQKENLTKEQYCTMRGQCISGNADGAIRGLRRILRRKGIELP